MRPDLIEGGHPLRPFQPLQAPAVAVAAAARVLRPASGPPLLWLRYGISGAQQLRCPAPAHRPQRRDGLWQHTCLEAFVAEAGQEAYWEFNLAPSGDWAVYRLARTREGLEPDSCYDALPFEVLRQPEVEGETTKQPTNELTEQLVNGLTVELRCPLPPALASSPELSVGLTAVLEDHRGRLSYWALTHPAAEPDFHDRRGWILKL